MSKSIITIPVAKGTFAWAVAQLAKGHVVTRQEWHYMQTPRGLMCRHQSGEWQAWHPEVGHFEATDWELL